MGIESVGDKCASSSETSWSQSDYKAKVAKNRREEIVRRVWDQVRSRPADVVAISPAANDESQTTPVQLVAVPSRPAATKSGVFDPPVMFDVIRKFHLAATKTLDQGSGNVTLEARDFLKKLENFEANFIDGAVKIANKNGHSLSQDDLALVAHDLLRILSDAARDLSKWGNRDKKIADAYAEFLKTLAKFHIAYGAGSHFVESAKRTVDGAKVKNPLIDEPWAGVRSTSDKSYSVKAGVGAQTGGVDLSASLQVGVSKTVEATRDDDDDTLYSILESVDVGASARAKASAAGIASASATASGKLRVGSGTLTDAPTFQTLMEIEAARIPNKVHYLGHRSSHPSTRKYAEKWRKFAHKGSNALSSNAFRPDTDHHHFLDSKKIFRYSACQLELHSLADGLRSTLQKSMPSTWNSCGAEMDDFISAFKDAYPDEEFRVVNSIAISSIHGVTDVNGLKEKSGPLTSASQLVSGEAKAGLGIGRLGEVTASAGMTYLHKAKALDFEKLVDSHEILNPANAGSIERSTKMIEEARQLLTSKRSQHMFKLIDRVIDFKSLEGQPTRDCFVLLKESVNRLEGEHTEFLEWQREYLANPKGGMKAFEKINEKYFDNHFDIARNFKDRKFQMEFLARSHDAFSSALGVICNHLAIVREQAIREVNESKARLDESERSDPTGEGKKKVVDAEERLDRFDVVARQADDVFDALAAKFKSPQTSIPREDRLRCAFFQLPTRLTQDGQVATSSFGLSLTLPEVPLYGGTHLSDVISYLHPAVKMTLGIERQDVLEHVSPLRIGSFVTLSCDFNAALPYAALIDKAVEAMAESISKVAGGECDMTVEERIKFTQEIRRQLTAANAFELPANIIGSNMTRRVVMKFRKPIPPRGVPVGDFEGHWKPQYTRVEASTNTTIGLSTPNVLQAVGIPATLSVGYASSQTGSAPTSETIGTDVAYNALQFTDGNAWDEKAQKIDFNKLSNFYKHNVVHDDKNLNKDGRYVAMQLFDDPTCILTVLKNYRTYVAGEDPWSDYALLNTSTIRQARRRYRETLQSAPGQGTKKSLSEMAMSNLDPYALIKLPTAEEIAELQNSLSRRSSPKNMDIYLNTAAGNKAMTAYFQLMKAVNLDKAAYKQSIGFKPCVRPNAIPVVH